MLPCPECGAEVCFFTEKLPSALCCCHGFGALRGDSPANQAPQLLEANHWGAASSPHCPWLSPRPHPHCAISPPHCLLPRCHRRPAGTAGATHWLSLPVLLRQHHPTWPPSLALAPEQPKLPKPLAPHAAQHLLAFLRGWGGPPPFH